MTHPALIDLTGRRFGRTTAIKYLGKGRWLCRCDCGTETDVFGLNLRKGYTVSCGCYRKEVEGKAGIKHGLSESPEYKIWEGMVERCRNPNSRLYANYGGRGIKLKWRSFSAFYADMGPRNDAGLTIERINNDGHYEKSNCRWATREEQANNKTSSRLLSLNGCTMTLAQWSRYTGINDETIRTRIDRHGWRVDEALTTPSGSRRSSQN